MAFLPRRILRAMWRGPMTTRPSSTSPRTSSTAHTRCPHNVIQIVLKFHTACFRITHDDLYTLKQLLTAIAAMQIWRHKIGAGKEDVLVYHETDDQFYISVGLTRSKKFLYISAGGRSTPSSTPRTSPSKGLRHLTCHCRSLRLRQRSLDLRTSGLDAPLAAECLMGVCCSSSMPPQQARRYPSAQR